MTTTGDTEKRLWDIANNLRANSKLSSAEYSTPVLGLIFLRHAGIKFTKKQKELDEELPESYTPTDFQVKVDVIFQHFFDNYIGDFQGVYTKHY